MSESASATLERHVSAAMARHGWPGCAAAVVRRGEPDLLRGWGVADASTDRPVDEQTGFRIGSTGKTMTAMALAALVESGAVGYDDLFSEHVSSYDVTTPEGGPVRVRHLASHTAGLGDLRGWADVRLPKAGTGVRPGRTRPEIDDLYRRGVATPLPPGMVWRYANHGIGLLGSLIERAAGQDFVGAVDRLVLKPLGMTETGFGSEWLDDPRTAVGYTRTRGARTPVVPLDVSVAPAGSTVSRASDMAHYLRALLQGGDEQGQVLTAAGYESLLRPLHQPDPRQTQTATVWWVDRLGGHRVVRHGGAWTGFRSFCAAAPDDGIAVWFGVNGDEDAVEQVGLDLLRALLDAPPAVDELAALAGRSAAPLPPAGRYTVLGTAESTLTTWASARSGLQVTQSNGLACLRGDGAWRAGFPLLPIGGDDPSLFGTDTGGADALCRGYTTVQVIGTPAQPTLLVNGRTPYVRTTRRRRPWTPLRELDPVTRRQLEDLCLPGTA